MYQPTNLASRVTWYFQISKFHKLLNAVYTCHTSVTTVIPSPKFLFWFSHKLKIELQERNQITMNTVESAQPKWKSRNNAHMLSHFPTDNKIALGDNKALDPPSQIDFVKNNLVGHVQGLFQILESPFLLNPTIIMQGVPNGLTCFLNGPLKITWDYVK